MEEDIQSWYEKECDIIKKYSRDSSHKLKTELKADIDNDTVAGAVTRMIGFKGSGSAGYDYDKNSSKSEVEVNKEN